MTCDREADRSKPSSSATNRGGLSEHEVRGGGAHRQRLPEEEPSLHSCVVGHFKHYFDAFWVIHGWLWGETFGLPLLLLFQRLKLRGIKSLI